ncbi:hypothetical protein H4R34_005246 [Dimargaris verticillata]|uniref:Chitin-binding type-4 domain-containing protein n=1 Tax=Dimargaris verticillata TaxID=2761393 RepID=A0A9W8B2M7_9FUNG|nr:hypothetical protein H4R34_005246 [Dimargaris verticillata]
MISKFALAFASLLAGSVVSGHMHVRSPCVRRSPDDACDVPLDDKDYDIMSPISTFGRSDPMPLCRGSPKGAAKSTFKAGDTVMMQFDNNAIHKGGHCEFSISLDDKTFVALKTIVLECFIDSNGLNIPITIPETAPTLKDATLAWTWVNAEGNREFYMNCMDVDIEGVEGGQIVGPEIVIANYGADESVYPKIGQFYHGDSPRTELYENRPMITLGGDGAAAPTSTPTSTDDADDEPTPSATNDPSAPQPTATSIPGKKCKPRRH